MCVPPVQQQKTGKLAVVITKQDLPGTMSRMQINSMTCLPELKAHLGDRLTVLEVSTATLHGIDDLLEFLSSCSGSAP